MEFYLRVKPTNNLEGCTDGKYISYTSSQIPRGEWKTFAVDISGIDETCTEFSIYLFVGTTAYVRNITIS
ncbi:MAG: hypothetical protein J6K86_00030 [Clostridia bacterium]|nr:hypothetical protein [Clostridia bacterium]